MTISNPNLANRDPSGPQSGQAQALPLSVAEMTALANAFFRALPDAGGADQAAGSQYAPAQYAPAWDGPTASAPSMPASGGFGSAGPDLAPIAPPPPVAASAPSAGTLPGGIPGTSYAAIAAPELPSLPAQDKLPSEADLVRLAGEAASPTSSGVIPPSTSVVPGAPGAQTLSSSTPMAPGVMPVPASASNAAFTPDPLFAASPLLVPFSGPAEPPQQYSTPVHPSDGFAAASPTTAQLPGLGVPEFPTDWQGIGLSGAGASPFSLPFGNSLPQFGQRLFQPAGLNLGSNRGLNLDAALPAIESYEKYSTEDEAGALVRSTTPFYFLEESGTLLMPRGEAPKPAGYDPAGVGDLGLKRGLFDLSSARRDFPILNERVNGKPLVWLDNAATTQKPQSVIDRISWFYEHENSNIHRAAHELAARATDAYEDARQKAARFLNAASAKEIIFVRGATEAINLIAKSWGKRHIQKGDEIIVSTIEHHANIVPWQQLSEENGAVLRVIPVDDDGQILLDQYEKLLSPRTKLVSVAQVSNALGTILPTHAIVAAAHRYGARTLIDGAQSVSHMRADVQSLDCDFFVFSGHKIFGPTGIGVVYGKPDALAETPPWQGGGNMIVDVTFEKTVYQAPPARFEAGTGNIADAVGLGAALDYVQAIGLENIARHEHELLHYMLEGLKTIQGLRLIGTAKERAAVLSFVLEGFKTEEVGAALNREGIAVRSGHHCAQPSLRRFGVETSVRPSLALYNNYDDVDALIAALRRLKAFGA